MGRRKGIMTESFKYELAKDLGFYDTVMKEGWGGIRSRDAGNMTKRAVELAQAHMASQMKSH
ncbi:small, acid-soluble spore protein, alpha/beta type [Bacillus sp. FJAT-42376]|uniref:small, acid-soluble spore protein, alpha/beta type n=1 Tax=Bacillus sp. FJAT-42376 TaxID=2014076 RepID=UPI000F4D6669|nr:small, acid-soluble spore protein, alpha/beta type [Bacillus sp. FJAT-42376]AZB41183.1 small, acid-soluble spore protein, alpha/beta type [Bacillus sp. FJAT-42376]